MSFNIGIVGTNFISDWLAESLELVKDVKATAVYSRKTETGETFAKKHNIPEIYTDYSTFLESDIDAVYIASPSFAHKEQAIQAMEAKKHVLCEKTIVVDSEELDELIAVANKNQVILLEAMRPDFDPYMELLESLLPKIGTIRRVTLEMDQYSSRYDAFKEGNIMNAFNPKLANAAVMDIGVYPIHSMVRLFGAPLGIKSFSTKLHNGFEGSGITILLYPGFVGEVVYSKISKSVNPSVIEGELGSIKIFGLTIMERLEVHLRTGDVEEIPLKKMENNMHLEVEGFLKLIQSKDINHRFLEYSKTTLAIIDEIRAQNQIDFT